MTRPFPWEKTYPETLRWDIAPPRQSLVDLLEESAAENADAPFLEYRGMPVSFTELAVRVAAFASGLLRRGVGAGDRVALYLPNTPYHPISFFGVLKAGGIVVHLSPLDAERELIHKLEDSGARIIVTTNIGAMLPMALRLLSTGHLDLLIVGEDAAFGPAPGLPISQIPGNELRLVTFSELEREPAVIVFPALAPDSIALLQYTGGTTGTPKGAVHTHATLNAAVASYEAFYLGQNLEDNSQRDRVIAVLPLFHIYALVVLLLCQLKRGSILSLHLRFDPEAVLRDIEIGRATYFPGVPTMWTALNALDGIETRDFSSLRSVGSGGAPLPVEIAQRFERLTGQRLLGGWGMTETASAGTSSLQNGAYKPGSIGLPLPGIAIEIVDLDDPAKILGPGEPGEMRIKGPNIFKSYWNCPGETEKSFADGWFLTGDIGIMDPDGMLFLVDRKKDIIISGGFNVYPRIIEDAIYEHPGVQEVIVIGIPCAYRGQAAKAFIKLRTGCDEFSLEMLREFLADKIGKHELPAALEFRDALPRTPVGKLSKKELIAEEKAASISFAEQTEAKKLL
jgi:long-chain acyl-CoA synthetase